MIPFPEDQYSFSLAVSKDDFPDFVRDFFKSRNTVGYFIIPDLSTPESVLFLNEGEDKPFYQ